MTKINIITLGESGVGKTSLLNRFKTGKFKESTVSTFVDHFTKTITTENIKTDAVIWDTAGQERYHSLIKRYYAMADGVLLVYDINDSVTFSKLSKWLSELRSQNETAEIIIVGNKNEDPRKRLVSNLEVETFIEKENLQHIEASAKTGCNVNLIFESLTKKILMSRGMLPVLQDCEHNSVDNLDSNNSTKFNSIKNEPEISFTYYGKSEQPKCPILTATNTVELIKEDTVSKKCFPC